LSPLQKVEIERRDVDIPIFYTSRYVIYMPIA